MKVCLVCSHGGHLTEMNFLQDAFAGCATFYITYDSVRTRQLKNAYLIDNFASQPMRIVASTLKLARILLNEKPDVVISTGAEIALPVFLLARIIIKARLIYIESWCRIHTPSFTGRIIYFLSDVFLVQWPQLLEHYGSRAQYVGAVI